MIYCKLVQAGSMPVSADVYRAAATKFWRHEKAWDLNTHEGKAEVVKILIQKPTQIHPIFVPLFSPN
jgi:hypothetical protein